MFRFIIFLLLITRFCVSQNWVNYHLNGGMTKMYYSQSLNKLIFGGNFNQVEGKYIPGVATFDGTNFDSLGSGINWALSGSNIKSFAEYKGKLYMAGGFSYLGNTHATNIAKWNGTKWDSLGEQLNATAYALKVHNNELYVGGYFWKVGNTTVNAIVKYDGTNWIPIGTGLPFNTGGTPVVFDIEFFNNELYVAGAFYDSSGNQFQLAKFNGTTWSKVLQLNSGLAEINSMELYNNALYIGGRFYKSSGDPGNLIAKFDGTNWISLDNGITGLSAATVWELKNTNNKLYIAGTYNNVNGNMASSISYWNDTSLCALNVGNQPIQFQTLEWYNNTIYTGASYIPLGNMDTVKYFASIVPSSLNFSCSVVIGIQENEYLNSSKIYPNPTTSIINILDENNQLQNATIQIQNSLGQLVFSSPFNSQINLQNLSAGMYFLTVKDKDYLKTFKIIKE